MSTRIQRSVRSTARRRAAVSLALVAILALTSMGITGCQTDEGPTVEEVITSAIDELEAEAADLEDDTDRLASWAFDYDDIAIEMLEAEVAVAVISASEVTSGIADSMEGFESSALTERFAEAMEHLNEFCTIASEITSSVVEKAPFAEEFDRMWEADEAAWEIRGDYTDAVNDDDWDLARDKHAICRSTWVDLEQDALSAAGRWDIECAATWDSGFDELAEYFGRHVDMTNVMERVVDKGDGLNRYSSSQVNAFNNELRTLDDVMDELRDWNVTAAYTNPWVLFTEEEDRVDYLDEELRAFEEAIEDVEEMLESGSYLEEDG